MTGLVRFNIEAKLFPLQPELTAGAGGIRGRRCSTRCSGRGMESRVSHSMLRLAGAQAGAEAGAGIATGRSPTSRASDDTVYARSGRPIALAGGTRYQGLWRLGAKARRGQRRRASGHPTTSISRAAALAEAHALGLSGHSLDGQRAGRHAAHRGPRRGRDDQRPSGPVAQRAAGARALRCRRCPHRPEAASCGCFPAWCTGRCRSRSDPAGRHSPGAADRTDPRRS